MSFPILAVRIQYEHDVVTARQRTRQIAEALGFDSQQQTRLATAVSEIARNAFSYAGSGRVEFLLEGSTAPQLFSIRVVDHGRGIPNLDEIMAGKYQSRTGMGLGILGAHRLMDSCRIETAPGKGTTVFLTKVLPRRAPVIDAQTLPALIDKIVQSKPRDIREEFREQNQELLRTLDELRKRQEELINLNRELEDTNRGVVALYAELDEKADHLRRADEVKSRFLSNMSHEFRTPLNSVLALSRLLLDRTDGDLTPEQEIQVTFIRNSAESLFELVNDLLDLAKVEAGKITIHPVEFRIAELFGTLRGMLRPLLMSSSLNLVFDADNRLPPVFGDEGKISQILRNFISNSLKFTESGEIRVVAEQTGEGFITFSVRDTGIGIAPEDQERIFQEFSQVDHPLQRKVKGTGLGLPLSKKLAELLGGAIGVESEVGRGATFWLRIPVEYDTPEPAPRFERSREAEPGKPTILILDDHYETRLLYERSLQASPWSVISTRSVREAENALRNVTPAAIVLDIVLQGEDSWNLLARLKADPATRAIPVLVATAVDDSAKAIALGADMYVMKPLGGRQLLDMLASLMGRQKRRRVLLIDDQEVSRYLLRQILAGPAVHFAEAATGAEGLALARDARPDLVIMDPMTPGMNGFETIKELKSDPDLRSVPLIISTSKLLSPEEARGLSQHALAILPKDRLSDSDVAHTLQLMLANAGLEDLIAANSEERAI